MYQLLKTKLWLGDSPKNNARLLMPHMDIYSFYIRYTKQYELVYYVSDNPSWNTLSYETVQQIIESDLVKSDGIVCFGQPSIDLIVEIFDPFFMKLASNAKQHFKQYELEDLYQTCRYVVVLLYNKGYYLHKQLIANAFRNELLVECRHKPVETVSIDDSFDDDDELAYGDTLEDLEYKYDDENKLHEQSMKDMFVEVQEYVIERIGERGCFQLFRELLTGNTSVWGRSRRLHITRALNAIGITKDALMKKHYWR